MCESYASHQVHRSQLAVLGSVPKSKQAQLLELLMVVSVGYTVDTLYNTR